LDSDCVSPGTCSSAAADYLTCGNYGSAFNSGTVRRAEFLYDYMISPVIEKVNQGHVDLNGAPSGSGFPFTVEFQRLSFNMSDQLYAADQVLYVDIDNNIDNNNPQALVKAGIVKGDARLYYITSFAGPVDPYHSQYYYNQRT